MLDSIAESTELSCSDFMVRNFCTFERIQHDDHGALISNKERLPDLCAQLLQISIVARSLWDIFARPEKAFAT